jgi:hypothetical protein
MMRTLPLSLVLAFAPGSALACAVCAPGSEETRNAFMFSTLFMTTLPLLLIFSGLFWLRRTYMASGRR